MADANRLSDFSQMKDDKTYDVRNLCNRKGASFHSALHHTIVNMWNILLSEKRSYLKKWSVD